MFTTVNEAARIRPAKCFLPLEQTISGASERSHPKGRNEVKESRSEAERLDGARCGATVSERGRKMVVRETGPTVFF